MVFNTETQTTPSFVGKQKLVSATQFKKLSQKRRRKMGEINQLKARQKKQQDSSRKAETRTKIQLGGLVLKSEFAKILGIEVGDDLQLDLTKREATEMLLGALVDMKDRLDQDPFLASSWSALGQTWFAKHL